eukprot:14618259-Alexandrium_andersonii.AAC.1
MMPKQSSDALSSLGLSHTDFDPVASKNFVRERRDWMRFAGSNQRALARAEEGFLQGRKPLPATPVSSEDEASDDGEAAKADAHLSEGAAQAGKGSGEVGAGAGQHSAAPAAGKGSGEVGGKT